MSQDGGSDDGAVADELTFDSRIRAKCRQVLIQQGQDLVPAAQAVHGRHQRPGRVHELVGVAVGRELLAAPGGLQRFFEACADVDAVYSHPAEDVGLIQSRPRMCEPVHLALGELGHLFVSACDPVEQTER